MVLIAIILVGINNISYSNEIETSVADKLVEEKVDEGLIQKETINEPYFSKQPETIEDLEKAINIYNNVLTIKPKWEFMVDKSIIPEGYYVDKVESNEGDYYTFFKEILDNHKPVREEILREATTLTLSVTTAAELQAAIDEAPDGSIIKLTENIDLEGNSIFISKNITLTSVDRKKIVHLFQNGARHIEITGGGELTLRDIYLLGPVPLHSGIDYSEVGNTLTGGGIYISGDTSVLNVGVETQIISNFNDIGGGVYLKSGTVNMYGGNISENSASDRGAGIFVESGTFNLYDGFMEFNGGSIDHIFEGLPLTGDGGGAIYIDTNGSLNMTGGSLYLNFSMYGAGICSYGTTTITGGTLEYNGALTKGAGIFVGSGKTTIKGNVNIHMNMLLDLEDEEALEGDGDGAGIYTVDTRDYSNLIVDENVSFKDNMAVRSYSPPSNKTIEAYNLWPSITNYTSSKPYEENNRLSPMNNDDINVVTREVIYSKNHEDSNEHHDLQIVAKYQSTVKPEIDPIREGYDFLGWYEDIEGTIPFDFSKEIIENTVVYAKWKSSKILGSVKIVKKDDNENLLENVEFKLQKKNELGNWVDIETKLTNNVGELFFGKSVDENTLEEGSYRIIETKTSSGDYSLLKEAIEFNMPYEIILDSNEIPEDDSYENVVDNGTTKTYSYYNLTFTVKNSAVIGLPDAGGTDMIKIVYTSGIVLIILSAMIFIINKKTNMGREEKR